MARFYVPFTHRNNAIIVCPNYRLIPEHTGADILEDLNDFWTWFNNKNVTTYLSAKHENIELDYDHVLVTGESAGGHMALVSALTQPQGSIKSVMVQYPMTNYLRCEPTDMFFGNPTPKPESLDEHLASIKPGTVISSSVPPARGGISYVLAAYDRYREFFGYDTKLWSIGLIEDATHMPPTWIIHGGADSVVDVKDSEAFVAKWTEREVQGEVKLSVLPGMEHGFDIEYKEDEEEWLKEGLQWLEKRWLS
jgi:acetyl esterase/lipase